MYSSGNQVPGMAPTVVAYPVPYATSQRDPMVRELQVELRRHRYFGGRPDDRRADTAQAIQSFQASHNMRPDGIPSPYLLDMLRSEPVGYY